MATLPGLDKGVFKDPTPPATDSVVSPITIPNGTILVTTKTTNETIDNVNQIIDYISGDNSPNFIPQSAINNLVSDLAAKEVLSNKVVTVGTPGNDTNYPTEKAVRDALDLKEDSLGFTPENSANKGAVSGYAALDSSQLLLLANFPSGTALQVLRRNAANNALEFAAAGSEVLTWTDDHSAATNNLTNLGTLEFNANTTITRAGSSMDFAIASGSYSFKIVTAQFSVSDTKVNIHGNILDIGSGGHIQFDNDKTRITQVVSSLEFDVDNLKAYSFQINNNDEFVINQTIINAHDKKIINVTDPTNAQDVVTKAFGDANYIGSGSLDNLSDVTITGTTINDIIVSDVEGAWINRQGIFTGITGLGIQTQDLQFGSGHNIILADSVDIRWVNGNRRIFNDESGFIFEVEENDDFKLIINTDPAYIFTNTDLTFVLGQNITGAGFIDFAESGGSKISGIATALGIKVDLEDSDIFRIDIDGTPAYTFDDAQADFAGNNLILSGGHIEFNTNAVKITEIGTGLVFELPDTASYTFEIDSGVPVLTISQANINAHSRKIVGVEDPVNPKDVVTKAFGDANYLGGSGDVVGPGTATDNAIARFSGTTGKIIQNSIITIDDLANLSSIRALIPTASNSFPSTTVAYFQYGNNGQGSLDFEWNILTGNKFRWTIQGTQEYNFTATEANFLTNNIIQQGAYHQFTSISSPASTGNVAIGRLFLDADNSHHVTIQRNGVEVDLEETGGGGSGDVVGPASSVDNAIVVFDETTGKSIDEGGSAALPPTIDIAGNMILPRFLQFNLFNTVAPITQSTIQYAFSEMRFNTSSVSALFRFTSNGSDRMIISTAAVQILNKRLIVGTSTVEVQEIATPTNPASNNLKIYAKDVAAVTHLFVLDSAGTETDLLAGGGGSDTPWIEPHDFSGELLTWDVDATNDITTQQVGDILTTIIADNVLGNGVQIAGNSFGNLSILTTNAGNVWRGDLRNEMLVTTDAAGFFQITSAILPLSDSGINPVMVFDSRQTDNTTIISRDLFSFRNNGASMLDVSRNAVWTFLVGTELHDLNRIVMNNYTGGENANDFIRMESSHRIVWDETSGNQVSFITGLNGQMQFGIDDTLSMQLTTTVVVFNGGQALSNIGSLAFVESGTSTITGIATDQGILVNLASGDVFRIDLATLPQFTFSSSSLDMHANSIVGLAAVIHNDGGNIIFGTTGGSMIGTAAAQKLSFWGVTPIIQPIHVANPSGGATVDAEARTAINSILAQLASMGLQASS